jgi:hypothetical protein
MQCSMHYKSMRAGVKAKKNTESAEREMSEFKKKKLLVQF